MLLFVQSIVAVMPAQSLETATAVAEVPAMPCEHGDCCDEDAPPSTPCDDMKSCASSDCALRAIASLPAFALVSLAAPPMSDPLPPDATRWLLTRHDAPLLRPPISA